MSFLSGEYCSIFAAALWGLNYPMVKLLLRSVTETDFLVIRFTLAVLIFALYLRFAGENFRIRRQDIGRILLLGIFGVGFYNLFWTYGIHKTTAANAALLISTSPIFTGLIAVMTKEEKISAGRWLGTLLAFAGIYLVIQWSPGAKFQFDPEMFTGNMLVLAGALLFALYAVVAKPLLQHYSATKLTTLSMMSGLPVILIYCLAGGWSKNYLAILANGWLEFAYVIVAGTVAAFIFWYKGIQQTSVVRAVLFHYIVPVGSMIFGWLLLGEQVALMQMIGGVLIFTGLIIARHEIKYNWKQLVRKMGW